MLESPLVALLAKIIVHIIIIHHPRERQTDKTKEGQEKRRTSQLVSQQKHRLVGHSLFFSLFALVFNKWFIIYHTKTTERSNTNFFGDESLRRLVFNNKSSSSESCLSLLFPALLLLVLLLSLSVCVGVSVCIYVCNMHASCSFFPLLEF